MDQPVREDRSATPDKPDLLWTPEIEAAIEKWQKTGVFPFPELHVYPAPLLQTLTLEDLRLIYHVSAISRELDVVDAGNFTIWTRRIPLYVAGRLAWHFF